MWGLAFYIVAGALSGYMVTVLAVKWNISLRRLLCFWSVTALLYGAVLPILQRLFDGK